MIIPLCLSYLMPQNSQITISPTVVKKYNTRRSVCHEALEWFKITISEGRSVYIPTIGKKIDEEALDFRKIDIMEPTTKDAISEYTSIVPNIE